MEKINLSQQIARMINLPPETIISEREKFENWYIETCGAEESDKEIFFATYSCVNTKKSDVLYYMNDYFDKLFCAWLMGVQSSIQKD